MFWICAIILFVTLLGLAFVQLGENDDAKKAEQEAQRKFIAENNISVTTGYYYSDTINTVRVRYVVDEKNETIYIADTSPYFLCIPFSEIIGYEISIDSQVIGGVGRAIVGGVLAGGTGALVGAMTAKPHIFSYEIVIFQNDISSPEVRIPLINKKTSTKDKDYINAVYFATKVQAGINTIIYRNNIK